MIRSPEYQELLTIDEVGAKGELCHHRPTVFDYPRWPLLLCCLGLALPACVRAGGDVARDATMRHDSAVDLASAVEAGPFDALVGDGSVDGSVEGGAAVEAGPPCSNSACVLATGMLRPFALTVRDGRIYVADFGDEQAGLFSLPVTGGAPAKVCTAGGHVYSLITDGVDLFWGQATGIMRLSSTGTGPAPIATTTEPRGVTLADGWIYWVRGDPNGGVYRVAKAGGPVQTLHAGTGGFQNVVVVGTMAYLTTGGTVGQIVAVPISGGQPTTIASGQGGPWGIASNGKVLVWANHDANELVRYELPNGSPTVIASGVGGAHQVAMVGDIVYATADTAGRVVRVRPGQSVEDLATGVGRPKNLVVAGDYLYFTDDQGGRVLRVAR